ncbi:MAG: beta-lactamase, partial [Proteobacteria bacterium]|nr:beta-lactamase [Pseudomonadota bacterium]
MRDRSAWKHWCGRPVTINPAWAGYPTSGSDGTNAACRRSARIPSGFPPTGARGDASRLFPYWSFTKAVIALCALKLSERGEIDLDAPLDGEPYTLRQLLNHTAGLPDYCVLADYHKAVAADEAPWPRDKLLGAGLAKGLLFAPGEGWSYSNIGYMLARERIEGASGQSFASLVEDIICRPLGLNSIELATTREQFRRVHWRDATRYH